MADFKFVSARAFRMWSTLGCGDGPTFKKWRWNIWSFADTVTIWSTRVFVLIRIIMREFAVQPVRMRFFRFWRLCVGSIVWCHVGQERPSERTHSTWTYVMTKRTPTLWYVTFVQCSVLNLHNLSLILANNLTRYIFYVRSTRENKTELFL